MDMNEHEEQDSNLSDLQESYEPQDPAVEAEEELNTCPQSFEEAELVSTFNSDADTLSENPPVAEDSMQETTESAPDPDGAPAVPLEDGSESIPPPVPKGPVLIPLFNKLGLPIHVAPGPEEPCKTIYIRNLPEKKGHTTIRRHLMRMFELFGPIIDVRVNRGLMKRGQAWVIFKNLNSAKLALKEMHGKELYGKKMIVQYARMNSKVIAEEEGDMEAFEQERVVRREQRLKAQAERAVKKKELLSRPAPVPIPVPFPAANPMHILPVAPLPGPVPAFPPLPMGVPAMGMPEAPMPPRPPLPVGGMSGLPSHLMNHPPPARPPVIPDELAPPNPTLFVSGLPEGATEEQVILLFNPFPGFKEVRLVPGKADIAFIDFNSEMDSSLAKETLHNTIFPNSNTRIKVNFRK